MKTVQNLNLEHACGLVKLAMGSCRVSQAHDLDTARYAGQKNFNPTMINQLPGHSTPFPPTTPPPPAKQEQHKMASDGKKSADAPSGSGAGEQQTSKDVQRILDTLSPQQLSELIALNPALAQEVAQATGTSNPTPDQAAEMLKKMKLEDLMSGFAASGKNVKDMASYKFWATQPVPRFDEDQTVPDGPLRVQTVDQISKEPADLVSGFEWVTMDLKSEEEIKEVYELLNGHYVEDDDSTFRFNYSPSILRWYVPPESVRSLA